MDDRKRLGEDRILPLVMRMALPLVLSMAFQAIYNIADSLFISRYSEIAFAGVSLVQPLVLITTTVASGIGTGTSSLLSKRLGEEDQEKAAEAVGCGWWLAIVLTVSFMAALFLFSSPFLAFFTSDPVASAAGLVYIRIFTFAVPFIYLSGLSSFILQSHGHSRDSMTILVTGSVINILLDPVFVFLLDLGAAGAAIASLLGFVLSAFVGLYLLWKRKVTSSRPLYERIGVRLILGIALPAFLSMGAGNITSVVINRLVISYGVEEMVVYGMYLKMESFMFLAVSGVSSALVVIAGYNLGANKLNRIRSSFWVSLGLGWSTMLLGFLFMQTCSRFLVGLFTRDAYLLEKGIQCFRLVSFCLLFTSPNLILQGLLQGLGKGSWSLFLCYMRFFVFLIPLSILLSHFLGVNGVYLSYFAADVPTLFLDLLVYRKAKKTFGY